MIGTFIMILIPLASIYSNYRELGDAVAGYIFFLLLAGIIVQMLAPGYRAILRSHLKKISPTQSSVNDPIRLSMKFSSEKRKDPYTPCFSDSCNLAGFNSGEDLD